MRFSIIILLFLMVFPMFGQETQTTRVNPYAEKPLKSNQFLYFEAEQIGFSFSEFDNLFHKQNIELLETPKLFWGLEYGVQYKRIFYSVQFSLGRKSGSLTDSIDNRTNYNRFGLAAGYYVINSKRVQFLAKMEWFYNSINLKNFSSSKDIPLNEYLENPNIDLGFNQFTSNIGVEINWKIPNISSDPRQPFIIGLSAGYNFNLGKTSIKSENNTLKSKNNISINPLSVGLHFTVYL